jgi:hypothetical protein
MNLYIHRQRERENPKSPRERERERIPNPPICCSIVGSRHPFSPCSLNDEQQKAKAIDFHKHQVYPTLRSFMEHLQSYPLPVGRGDTYMIAHWASTSVCYLLCLLKNMSNQTQIQKHGSEFKSLHPGHVVACCMVFDTLENMIF